MGAPASPVDPTRILLFNVTFFGTLAWLASAADVGHENGWWYEQGQFALALAGIVLFWIAWWHDDQGRPREALRLAAPGLASLSVWLTSVHSAL